TVKIEYRYTSPPGNWVTIADSAPNTGVYAWSVPNEPQGLAKGTSVVYSLRMRVSGPDYVWADSVNAGMLWSSGILPDRLNGPLSFSVPGHGTALSGLSAGTRVEIQDASGRRVRSLALGEESTTWDLANSRGERVRPGMYFFRAMIGETQYRVGH